MPLPSGLYRIQVRATLHDGEAMVHNLWAQAQDAAGGPTIQNIANGVRDAWTTNMTTVKGTVTLASLLSSSTKYQDVTVYAIDENTGKAKDLAAATFGATAVGGGTGTLPTEVAVAVTLLTGQPGRSRRGRIYLGGFSSGSMTTATGRLTDAAANACAGTVAGVLTSINALAPGADLNLSLNPVVMSLTTNQAYRITSTSCGNVFDVQRRRRNKLVEVRQVATVT